MKCNDDDDDDDQIIHMDWRPHQSSMLMLLNKEELYRLSCAKNISIEDFFSFFLFFFFSAYNHADDDTWR